MAGPDNHRIVKLTLDERTVVRRSADIEHERAVAIYDLIEDNRFAPVGDYLGPYHVNLGIADNRIVLDIADVEDRSLGKVVLPLASFRKIVKDYFAVCESYYAAIKTSSPSQIEAIDMGRRGLHNEGSELLIERLAGKIDIDFATGRHLFTLLCVLHIRG